MNLNVKVSEEKILSTNRFIETISKSFSCYIKKEIIQEHPSIFVQGQPGIGKSQAVNKIASNLEKIHQKRVVINDVRLLLFTPVDLRGIPVPDLIEKTAIWLIPKVFKFDKNEDVINILFLDELTSAPSSLQAAAYQIALDRKLGEHIIPNNTFIIAAGNRLEDNSISYEMPSALKNRFIHFELAINFEEWLLWAVETSIHPEIIKFLKANPDKFSSNRFESHSNIIITPRSWEFLSKMLYNLEGSLEENEPFIASIIGSSLTSLFLKSNNQLSIEDVINGKVTERIDNLSDLQRMIDIIDSQLLVYAPNQNFMQNILEFLLIIPTDFAIRIFRKIVKIKIDEYDISTLSAYQEFLVKLGEYSKNEE